MRRVVVAMLSISIVLLQWPGPGIAVAEPGDLDSSFDGDGRVTTSFAGQGPLLSAAHDVVVQQDGRIVAAGFVTQGPESTRDFALTRYLTDGQLDPTFGTGGRVITSIGPEDDMPGGMALQADGKLVVVGSSFNLNPTRDDFSVVRYLPNGTLDPSFSSDGKLMTAVSATATDMARAVAIQPDGKIVAAGYARIGTQERFALTRYLKDGQLDPAFGNGGIVTTAFGAGHATASTVAIQPDGRIVLAGQVDGDVALARYLENGQLDPQFGNGGKKITVMFGHNGATSISVQDNGMIVVGAVSASVDGFILMRYQSFGALDHTFGSFGIATTPIVAGQKAIVTAVSMHAKNTIVAAGFTSTGSSSAMALARYLPNGQLDPQFGSKGTVVTPFKADYAKVYGLAFGKNNVIVAAGDASGNGSSDFAVARYLAE
jgi:uncharacterized delta-60 repeat protein